MGRRGNVAIFVPHVGCPRHCTFCDQRAITGQAAQPSPADVARAAGVAARSLEGETGETEIAFFGGSFTAVGRDYMLCLLQAAAQAVKDYRFAGIRVSTRPDAVETETLSLLQSYGVTAIELGAQSMDDRVLALNRRGHTAAQTAEAAGRVREMGFELGLQMMTGLYGDTDAGALHTAERIIALRPCAVRVYPAVVLPGTGLAQLYGQGLYKPQTLEGAIALCARLLPRFEAAGVKVLRMGLHAQPEVGKKVLAGPYHPAFRQLVESRLFLGRLLAELEKLGPGVYRVAVKPSCLSTAQGQGKSNQRVLAGLGYQVAFAQDSGVGPYDFRITPGKGEAT